MAVDLNWTEDQKNALEKLKSRKNIFITGGAGTGKSTLVKAYLGNSIGREATAVLASTGAAAILVGGRTFHSFFGLGIMEGGMEKIVERAAKHFGIAKRLKETHTILIDEISMIGPQELMTAEAIARKVRQNTSPWGGLRIIAVGDFAQLPPVQVVQNPDIPRWSFESPVWQFTELNLCHLREIVRSKQESFSRLLSKIRFGQIDEDVVERLSSRIQKVGPEFEGTQLFARRAQVESLNLGRLGRLKGVPQEFSTVYMGLARAVDDLKKHAPIPETLVLKEGALVMFRQNDPEKRWVNGTQGHVLKLGKEEIEVELLSGRRHNVRPVSFSILDQEGDPIASATNFPLNLAWASTIHKVQGATLDRVHADLKGVWEHGQSYVALSRTQNIEDLTIEGLSPRCFVVDPRVQEFYGESIGC
jgi:ATP-dependent DNA helicase PIF1